MFRRRKRFSFKILFVVALFGLAVISFVIGYNNSWPSESEEGPYAEENNPILDHEEIEMGSEEIVVDDEEAEVVYQEESIGEETIIRYQTFYTICKNTIEEKAEASNDMIGLTENGLKEYLVLNSLLFDIESFSIEEVLLIQNKDTVCPNHYNYYWLQERDGYIHIYQFNERGQRILVERTSITTSRLPLVDQEKLKEGILRRTRDEVNQLLEDYSS